MGILFPNVLRSLPGVHSGSGSPRWEERPPSALAQEGNEQATETVQMKEKRRACIPWAMGLGTRAGDIQGPLAM